MGVSLISKLPLTASSHTCKDTDTGFIFIGALYILVILKFHHTIDIYTSVGFSMALGYLNKNSSSIMIIHPSPRYPFLSPYCHICSMKPCIKDSILDQLSPLTI